ncbi:hypothetical protein J6590_092158 [Homalodisca vitripennis]|nr:hypothetical protein J6590_092158 [Homalodisca vitripennis]
MTSRDSEVDHWVDYYSDDSVSVDIDYAELQGTPNCEKSDEDDVLGMYTVDYHTFYWVGGDDPDTGVCMETDITLTTAISPAFLIENYNWTSGEFSSWTESVWPEMSLRMFLKPAFNQELYTLISGVVVLFLSFSSVYWVNRHAGQLFNPL